VGNSAEKVRWVGRGQSFYFTNSIVFTIVSVILLEAFKGPRISNSVGPTVKNCSYVSELIPGLWPAFQST
jgi:hypothetical protein